MPSILPRLRALACAVVLSFFAPALALADGLNGVQQTLLRPLALYPPDTRMSILDLAGEPKLIEELRAGPARLDDYPQPVREAARDLQETPEVIEILHAFPKYVALIASIYEQMPAEVEAFVRAMPMPAAARLPVPSDAACWAGNPGLRAQVERLRAALGRPSGAILESAELITALLEDSERWIELAVALLEYAAEVPIEAVAAWVARMEQAIGCAYEGNARQFLEHVHLVKRRPEARGKFWENSAAVAEIQADLGRYGQLAGKLLAEHARAALPGVEQWKRGLGDDVRRTLESAQARVSTATVRRSPVTAERRVQVLAAAAQHRTAWTKAAKAPAAGGPARERR